MQYSITPREISPDIKRLCAEIVHEPKPVFLELGPGLEGEVNDCFAVVQRCVERDGGAPCYGWQIWEWPLVMIEAEFHAVWKDRRGDLHEVTPKQVLVQNILFLPDPVRTYQGRQINNIRRPLSSESDVAEFIAAAEREFEFINRGDRADQHGALVLEGPDADEYDQIVKSKAVAMQRVVHRLSQIGRNQRCPCGNGKKYKLCHGR